MREAVCSGAAEGPLDGGSERRLLGRGGPALGGGGGYSEWVRKVSWGGTCMWPPRPAGFSLAWSHSSLTAHGQPPAFRHQQGLFIKVLE